MKISNILIAAFIIVVVVASAILAYNISTRLDVYKERSKMVEGDRSQMQLTTLLCDNKVAIEGNDALQVYIKRSPDSSAKVWVERSFKDSVVVNCENGTLKLVSKMKSRDAIVIVYIPNLKMITIRSANCSISDLATDLLKVDLRGNSDMSIEKSSISSVELVARDNASMDVDGSVKVNSWSIRLDGNANLSGVSPNSKLSMSVTGNAHVSLAN